MRYTIAIGILFAVSVARGQSDPPAGYTWSAPLPKPPALTFNQRHPGWGQAGGNYDFMVTTVGDNWCISNPSGYGSINVPPGGIVSVRYAAGSQEPSCGWMAWRRGPYAAGAAESTRGPWEAGQPENAGPYPMVSMPIITHHGGDFRRYWTNGWPWLKADYFTQDGPFGQYYKRTQSMGPLQLDGTRKPLPNPDQFAPDLTLLNSVPNKPIYVSCCWVDQFGRESKLSDPVLCPATGGTNATTVEVSRRFQPPQGAVAIRLYCGTRSDSLFRQVVLNREGEQVKWDWPLHLSRFCLHNLTSGTPPQNDQEAKSWLNPVQQAVEAGEKEINKSWTWQLYCPFILKYDPNNFGRTISGAKLIQNGNWSSPAVIVLNQRDTLSRLQVNGASCASIATSDFSGGQAFSNQLIDCTFTNGAQDGYGLLIDECSSYSWGEHTASELLARHCVFTAARPVKLEGRQTAKIRFDDRCTFNCTGNTRYGNECCAIEHFAPNAVVLDTIEGVNGNFRTFVGMCNNEGAPVVRIRDVFIDRGMSVGFAFGPNTGGVVDMQAGDRFGIYPSDRSYFRLAEAPNSNNSRLSIKGLNWVTPNASILSYNLNQLAIDLDRPVKEIVTPTESDWVARGLYLNFGGKDWRIKPVLEYQFGYDGMTDTLPRKSPMIAPPTP